MVTIKIGFITYSKTPISAFTKVNETRNNISSPAASFNRIEIFYKKFNRVIISPKRKQDFMKRMLQINPAVEVKHKKEN